ncbi:MAG: helix-turn-helix domain-containing protein [Candidatus Omnitrophica bacterium]|nr:helix-turn-helix domain-containing protein [Candidatus Omnitrophota bacterium]
MFNRKSKQNNEEYLEIEAGMKGTLEFKNPVRIRISGGFEGSLSMKGALIIGENALVSASIESDFVTIYGGFSGEITANKTIRLMRTSRVEANITTRAIFIEEGAVFNGGCNMLKEEALKDEKIKEETRESEFFDIEELSNYLEVDKTEILDWVRKGTIPCSTECGNLKFRKQDIDKWVEDNILR